MRYGVSSPRRKGSTQHGRRPDGVGPKGSGYVRRIRMSYERVRKSAAVTVALMAFAIWASMTPASASPPVGTPGTPALFTNKVFQPIGIAADQNRILVTQPYCPGTAVSPTPPSFTVQTLDATGTPTLYASIPEPYDAAALQGLVNFNVGLNGQSDPASSNCGEMHIVIS